MKSKSKHFVSKTSTCPFTVGTLTPHQYFSLLHVAKSHDVVLSRGKSQRKTLMAQAPHPKS